MCGLQTLILDAGSIGGGRSGGEQRRVRVDRRCALPNAALSFSGLPEFFETDGRPSLLDGGHRCMSSTRRISRRSTRATADVLGGRRRSCPVPARGRVHASGLLKGWATGLCHRQPVGGHAGAGRRGTWHPVRRPAGRRVSWPTLDPPMRAISNHRIDTGASSRALAIRGEVGRLSFRTAAFVGGADHDASAPRRGQHRLDRHSARRAPRSPVTSSGLS